MKDDDDNGVVLIPVNLTVAGVPHPAFSTLGPSSFGVPHSKV
jgi:hypothetical protein